MYEGAQPAPIVYRGASMGEISHLAKNDLRVLLPSEPKASRQLLFAVVAELVRNADKYGSQSNQPGELEINSDANGVYVTVTSYGSASNASELSDIIEKHRFDTDEELKEAELETMERNRGSDKSGIGILQVIRRSKVLRGMRLIDVQVEPAGRLKRVQVRAYVG